MGDFAGAVSGAAGCGLPDGALCCFAAPDGAAGRGSVTGVLVSKMDDDGLLPAKYPSVRDVIINTIAIPVVSRVKKLPAPLLPKIVALDPPNTAPTSAPLPVCSKTTRIKPTLTMT